MASCQVRKSYPQLLKMQARELEPEILYFADRSHHGVTWNAFHTVNTDSSRSPVDVIGDPSLSRVIVSNCSNCALFRSEREPRGSCTCKEKRMYNLDPGNATAFELYRWEMGQQLKYHQKFFREHFLDVLRSNPELGYNTFSLGISVGIQEEGVNVECVRIDPVQNPESWPVNEWKERIGTWNKDANEQNEAIGRKISMLEPLPNYAGVGIIVIAFEVRVPKLKISFKVQMELPLLELELIYTGERRPLDWTWACDFADKLSDSPPTLSTLAFDGLLLYQSKESPFLSPLDLRVRSLL